MKFFLKFLILNLFPFLIYGQNIYVKYKFTISDVSSTCEQLYVHKNNILNVRDSVISFKADYANSYIISKKDPPHKVYYYRNLKDNKILIDTYLESNHYLVTDIVPKINWKINIKKTKKVLKYNCTEATGMYRGNKITAFFTKDIPISAGPYKFGGLPGLILELHGDDITFNTWKATEVELHYGKKLSFNYNSKLLPISNENFIKLGDKKNNDILLKLTKNLPSNATLTETKIPRQTIEKIYEWEKK